MPNGPQVYRIRGLDCAGEVAALKRELGPLVGGDANLGFGVLNGKLAAVAMASPGQVRAAVARAGLRAGHWEGGEAVRGGRPWRPTPGRRLWSCPTPDGGSAVNRTPARSPPRIIP